MQKLREGLLKRPLGRGAIAIVLTGALVLAFAGAFALHNALGAGGIIVDGPTSTVDAGGLELSMQAAAGPYFLSELLPVRMTLTNNSQTTYTIAGAPVANECGQTMWASLTGGTAPTFTPLVHGAGYCPLLLSTFHPGQTWTIVQLLPLTASGHVTITAGVPFLAIVAAAGSSYTTNSSGPFDDHWPGRTVYVASTIPTGRTIQLRQSLTTHQVRVVASAEAEHHLYYLSDATCQVGQGATEEPIYTWKTLGQTTLEEPVFSDEPYCPGKNETWTYAVAAPGYAIASGEA